MSSNQGDTTRRRLLKSIGATSLAFGATGAASATPSDHTAEELRSRYGTAAATEQAVTAHASSVLEELASRGVVERASAAVFDLSDATLVASDDGARIVATTETDAHSVTLAVRPDSEEAVASVEPAGDGDPFTLRSEADDEVSTQDHCYYEHRCTNYPCSDGSGGIYLERHCCEYPDETQCSSWEQDGCCL